MAHICLIEDDPMVRNVISRILSKLGHSVQVASNGREGLEFVQKLKFDLVITDIIMPEVEGIQVLQKVKESSPSTKVIAMSGGGRIGNTDFLEVAKSLGADAVVYKPVTKTEFMAALKTCLAVAA